MGGIYMRCLIRALTLRLIKYCEKYHKVFVITGSSQDGEDKPYLIRYLVINTKYFCFYVHRFLRSDHDGPHDHPWSFFTYIVDGGYIEEIYEPYYKPISSEHGTYCHFITHRRERKIGSLAFKSKKAVHKVILKEEFSIVDREKAPLTLCITGPRVREWGFWKGVGGKPTTRQHYSAKWVLWKDFLGIKNDREKRG